MIRMKDVWFNYDEVTALKKINLEIKAGESVALLGANGSGKSTLLRLLNGILFPQNGNYFFDEQEITKKNMQDSKFSKSLHQKIGFVFQNSETQLFCTTVYDEIAFGPRQMGLAEDEVSRRVDDCLKLLHIERFRDRTPYHLSGGEKKKVAIACVLSMNPEVLILDEPLNGLDPKTQRWLMEFLRSLNENGKTLIIATHNLEYLEELTSRGILFNEQHEIVADANIKYILQNEELLKEENLVDLNYKYHERMDML